MHVRTSCYPPTLDVIASTRPVEPIVDLDHPVYTLDNFRDTWLVPGAEVDLIRLFNVLNNDTSFQCAITYDRGMGLQELHFQAARTLANVHPGDGAKTRHFR